MKRIHSACLYETLNFVLDPKLPVEEAKKKVKEEVKSYKEKSVGTTQILSEVINPDGTITLALRKKVSGYPIGTYFNN